MCTAIGRIVCGGLSGWRGWLWALRIRDTSREQYAGNRTDQSARQGYERESSAMHGGYG